MELFVESVGEEGERLLAIGVLPVDETCGAHGCCFFGEMQGLDADLETVDWGGGGGGREGGREKKGREKKGREGKDEKDGETERR